MGFANNIQYKYALKGQGHEQVSLGQLPKRGKKQQGIFKSIVQCLVCKNKSFPREKYN